MKKVAIMQPYFCPYIGYFQLISAVDVFVCYDDVQYIKGGWINRNRILYQGQDKMFTVPLKKSESTFSKISERHLSKDSSLEREKIFGLIERSYSNAPYYKVNRDLLAAILLYETDSLQDLILNSIKMLCNNFGIGTEVVVSSSLGVSRELRGQERVIAITKALGGSMYINSIGGMGLYQSNAFAQNGINLKFLRSRPINYRQFGDVFVPSLSIIDVMMFNDAGAIAGFLHEYDLLDAESNLGN